MKVLARIMPSRDRNWSAADVDSLIGGTATIDEREFVVVEASRCPRDGSVALCLRPVA